MLDPVDTPLVPHGPVTGQFTFPEHTTWIQTVLYYRRFWQQVAELKNWPDNEIVVLDQTYPVIAERSRQAGQGPVP